MDSSSKDLNKDAASFESKEGSSSIFGFSPIEEALDAPKDESPSAEGTSASGLTDS
jgi:hypothetical protein